MSYKLVCLDMDGTLLNNASIVSERNKEAIKRAHERGVKVAVSTGRIFTNADFYSELVGVRVPVIAGNGAVIVEKDDNRVVYKECVGKQNARKFVSLCEEFLMKPYMYTMDTVYYDVRLANGEKRFILETYKNKTNTYMPSQFVAVSNWSEVIDIYGDEILKCLSIDSNIDKIRELKNLINAYGTMEAEMSFPIVVEATRKGVNKGSAIQRLAEFYNIRQEEIMCVGDSENDLSMIEYAGLGVAMGNGIQSVKSASDYITDTNKEDGVAKAIEQFVLLE